MPFKAVERPKRSKTYGKTMKNVKVSRLLGPLNTR